MSDALALETLIQWLETKEPTEHYSYIDNRNCLLAQYLTAHGYNNVSVFPESFKYEAEPGFIDSCMMPANFDFISGGEKVASHFHRYMHWTFGHALERARYVAHEASRELELQ